MPETPATIEEKTKPKRKRRHQVGVEGWEDLAQRYIPQAALDALRA